MRFALYVLLPIAALLSQSIPSLAQNYPTRPIRVITVNGPGGTADIFLRALGQELQKRIGQPFVVEPRPGGNFMLGSRACAEAPTDGYTICMLNNEALAYNQFLFKKIPYDPAKDFAPITNLIFFTTALVVNSSLHVKSLDELIALAKAKPKTLAFVAPSMHQRLFFERINKGHGIDLVGVPFKGGGEAVAGILSGATPVAFFGLASFLPYLRDGTMTALAVDSDERSPLVPDVPTLAELGYRENLSRVYYGGWWPRLALQNRSSIICRRRSPPSWPIRNFRRRLLARSRTGAGREHARTICPLPRKGSLDLGQGRQGRRLATAMTARRASEIYNRDPCA